MFDSCETNIKGFVLITQTAKLIIQHKGSVYTTYLKIFFIGSLPQ